MVARTQFAADLEALTVSELVFSLKSAFQHSYFSRVEQILVSREDKLNKQIEEKHRENQLLLEKFLSFQKECGELREERDELLNRLKEKQDFEIQRKNSDHNSSHAAAADNRRPLSENIVEIIDSNGESSRGLPTQGQLHKPDFVQNAGANEPIVHKRKLVSSLDVDDGRPTGRDKRVNVEEPAVSTVEHRSPAAPKLETHDTRKGVLSSNLSKILSELGDDSSSSSSSDDEVDLSLDYSTIFRF